MKEEKDIKKLKAAKTKAKLMKTLPKQPLNSAANSIPYDFPGPSDNFDATLHTMLTQYEDVWRHSGLDTNPDCPREHEPSSSPDEYAFRAFLTSIHTNMMELQGYAMDLKLAREHDLTYLDKMLEATILRVSDADVGIGEVPAATLGLAPKLWTSIAQCVNDITVLVNDAKLARTRMVMMDQQVKHQDVELDKLFAVSAGALQDIQQNTVTLLTRLDDAMEVTTCPPNDLDLAGIQQLSALVAQVNGLPCKPVALFGLEQEPAEGLGFGLGL